MKLGILADIHEQTKQLRNAIAVLQRHGAERFVVLGDVFETGKRMEETVSLLQEVGAVGVWGNHDIGLCFDPDEKACERYSAAVLTFMGGLQPRLETAGCLFTHVEPWLDPHKVEDLWYFDGPPDSAEKLARSFAGPAPCPVRGPLPPLAPRHPGRRAAVAGGGAGVPEPPGTAPCRRPRRLGRQLRPVRHRDE
jgi:hypothetical protein